MIYDLNYLNSLLIRCVDCIFSKLSHNGLKIDLDWSDILESEKYTDQECEFLEGVMEGVYYKSGEESGEDVKRIYRSEHFNNGFDIGYEI